MPSVRFKIVERIQKSKYLWLLHAFIVSFVVMAIYTFVGPIAVSHFSDYNYQLFVVSSGFYNSFGLQWIILLAYLFLLVLIICRYLNSMYIRVIMIESNQ